MFITHFAILPSPFVFTQSHCIKITKTVVFLCTLLNMFPCVWCFSSAWCYFWHHTSHVNFTCLRHLFYFFIFLQPRYIQQLMKAMEDRKKEQERRDERKIQKEREAEGEQFADKEAYVTSAYKKKLQEQKEEEEREKREAALEGKSSTAQLCYGWSMWFCSNNLLTLSSMLPFGCFL